MMYVSAFLIGFLCAAGMTLFIRLWSTIRKRKHGFAEPLNELSRIPFSSDTDSKYAGIAQSIDGSRAVENFKN